METIIKYLDTSWFYGSNTFDSVVNIWILLLSWIPILVLGAIIILIVLICLFLLFCNTWLEAEKFLNKFKEEVK